MPTIAEYLTDPASFATAALGMRLYPWQHEVLMDLNLPGNVALRCCNAAGKTSVIGAAACLWHASVFPGSLTVVTSGTFRQVSAQLFPAIHRHSAKFPGATFNDCEVTLPNGSRIYGFSTDESGKFEGWHSRNLLVLVDEAKTVGDTIFEAISRCAPTRLLIMSSPGGCSGEFYRVFTERKKFYRCHVIKADQCPHITPEWVAEQTEKYGADSPLVKSMIHAEFMDAGEGGEIIPLVFLEKLLAAPPAFKDDGSIKAGCDFAAGGDSNCLAIRRGNKIEIAACWKEHDTARSIGKFVTLFRQHGLQPENIFADEGGMGCVFCDALAEAGWPVRRFNFGQSAVDSEHYVNAGAELWFTARRQIEKREIVLPNDPELVSQLSTRRGWADSKGRLALESKGDLRGRGIGSPDKADAILMSLASPARSGGWSAATLAGTYVGNAGPSLTQRPIFTPRFTTVQPAGSKDTFEQMCKERGIAGFF